MKFRAIIVFIILLTIFHYAASTTMAASVPWSIESYRSYVYATSEGETEEHELFGPPLSISSYASAPTYQSCGYAATNSEVTYTDMSVWSQNYFWCGGYGYATAEASFAGEYTATLPYFRLSYNFDYIYGPNTPSEESTFWISVDDITQGSNLYAYSISTNGSSIQDIDTITIPTEIGNNIKVYFGIDTSNGGYGEVSESLSYSMSTISSVVVPEPISSILFVTGGTLLVGRRYMKRKKA
jgi:hypothetical protein